jgi:hypothetical protein
MTARRGEVLDEWERELLSAFREMRMYTLAASRSGRFEQASRTMHVTLNIQGNTEDLSVAFLTPTNKRTFSGSHKPNKKRRKV